MVYINGVHNGMYMYSITHTQNCAYLLESRERIKY